MRLVSLPRVHIVQRDNIPSKPAEKHNVVVEQPPTIVIHNNNNNSKSVTEPHTNEEVQRLVQRVEEANVRKACIKPNGVKQAEFKLLDKCLTAVIAIGAAQDLTWAIFHLFYPTWFLLYWGGFERDEISTTLQQMTRVAGWGPLEAGTIGALLVMLRLAMAYKKIPFNGANFQFVFFVTFFGRGGAWIHSAAMSGVVFGPRATNDTYVMFSRALLSLVGFGLASVEYTSSWKWLYH